MTVREGEPEDNDAVVDWDYPLTPSLDEDAVASAGILRAAGWWAVGISVGLIAGLGFEYLRLW